MNKRYFFDTSSLLLHAEDIFEFFSKTEQYFLISSITLQELEKIKSSVHKDDNVKYLARLVTFLLEKYSNLYEVISHKTEYEQLINREGFEINNDTKILADVLHIAQEYNTINLHFITDDLSLKHIGKNFTNIKGKYHNFHIGEFKEDNNYTGYLEVIPTEEELEKFYSNPNENIFNLKINQYLVILDTEKQIKDIRVWTGETHRYLKEKTFYSDDLGAVKPYQGDIYQKMVCDSLINNKLTMIKGPAGTGKSYLSLGYLLSMLRNHQIDKIVVFCNTIATAHSAKLGFYPGTKDEKLLDSQIGNFLASKLGGRIAVESLIQQEKLILLPFSDIRGYDTSGMRAGVYITEAQNLDRVLMKLALQRIGEDCICIIDGDDKTQVDDIHFSGNNNGMRRVSKIYRGEDIYGEIELKNIYRSKIAHIAEKI